MLGEPSDHFGWILSRKISEYNQNFIWKYSSFAPHEQHGTSFLLGEV